MNLFNETIYKNHLEHSQKGQTWDKHKYLYITPSGRYVYPSDLENVKTSSNPALAKQRNARKIAAASENAYKDQIRSAHQGSALRNDNSISRSKRIDSSGWRTQAIANASGQQYSKQIEAQKRAAEARAAAAKTSGVAAGSKSVATPATRNTITIKKTETTPAKTEEKKTTATTATTPKTEEKKTETTTSTDGDKYKNMSEEMKEYLKKEAAKGEKKEEKSTGKKGSGGSKKKGSSSKASTKTEEASKMGLSDDDLKNMEVNTQATDREEVLKNIALRVIRGDYGNGADRKAKLGNYYDEVQKRVNELMKSGSIQREGQPAQQTSQKTDQKASTSSSQKEAKMEQYKDGDKDFDDKNYSEKNRLGNTDFFSYKRNDGKYVILEEDMKWVVDEKPSSKTIKNLEAFDKYVADKRKNGDKYTSDDWEKMASQAINGIDFTERTKKKTVKHVDPLNEDNFLSTAQVDLSLVPVIDRISMRLVIIPGMIVGPCLTRILRKPSPDQEWSWIYTTMRGITDQHHRSLLRMLLQVLASL